MSNNLRDQISRDFNRRKMGEDEIEETEFRGKQISFSCSESEKKSITSFSKKKHMSISNFIRMAVFEYIEKSAHKSKF